MNSKALKPIFLAILSLGCMALPSRGQDLNAELNNAICHQNWREAIEIIDRISAIFPQSASELEEYRDRLVSLQNSGARVPGWGGDCASPNLPEASSPSQPATTAVSPNSEELGSMVETLDRLKECKPYQYEGASVGFISMTIEIGGWNQERCAMRYIYADGSQLQCQLSQNGLAIMTNEKAYANARLLDEFQQSGNLDSRDALENPGLGDVFDNECQYIAPPDGKRNRLFDE